MRKSPVLEPRIPLAMPPPKAELKPPPLPFWTNTIRIRIILLRANKIAIRFKIKLIAKNGKMLETGTISLQSESHPVEFRKVELLKLDD